MAFPRVEIVIYSIVSTDAGPTSPPKFTPRIEFDAQTGDHR